MTKETKKVKVTAVTAPVQKVKEAKPKQTVKATSKVVGHSKPKTVKDTAPVKAKKMPPAKNKVILGKVIPPAKAIELEFEKAVSTPEGYIPPWLETIKEETDNPKEAQLQMDVKPAPEVKSVVPAPMSVKEILAKLGQRG